MTLCNKIVAATAVVFASSSAFGGIAYDTISNAVPTTTVTQVTAPWQAEDAILDTSFGNTLERVDLLTRLSLFGSPPTFSGSLTIAVFTSVPLGTFTRPGTLLASRTISHVWTQGVTEVMSGDFSGVTLTSNSIWVGWMFASSSGMPQNPGQGVPFVIQTANASPVGMSTSATAGATSATGTWQVQLGLGEFRAVRVAMVPEPGTVAVLGLGVVGLRRRR